MKKYLFIIASVSFTILIVSYISLASYIATKAEIDTKTKSEVILVLGARSYIDGKYNQCLEARVAHAAALYKSGYASKVLMSGGDDSEDNVNEAETMKKIAVERGVLAADILLEKAATSTYENFTLSQEILKENTLNSVIIVTEPFHMVRASLVAEKLNYNYTFSPAQENSCWLPNKYLTTYFLKEPVAIMQYKLQNKL